MKYVKLKSKPRTAKVTKSVKKYVKNVLNKAIETERADYAVSIAAGTAATNSTGTIVPLSYNAIQLINAPNVPEGDYINHISSHLKMSMQSVVENNVATNPHATQLRAIMFHWRDEALPTVADILEFGGWNDFINHQLRHDFTVMFDRLYQLDPIYITDVTTATQAQAAYIFTSQSLQHVTKNSSKKFKIEIAAGPGPYNGNVFLLLVSDQATAFSPSVDISYRFMYKDA